MEIFEYIRIFEYIGIFEYIRIFFLQYEYIRIRIRIEIALTNIFVFVFGPEKNIRSPLTSIVLFGDIHFKETTCTISPDQII